MGVFTPPGLGWHRDLPDPRDYTRKQDAVAKLLNDLPAGRKLAGQRRFTRILCGGDASSRLGHQQRTRMS